jgi:hypothetical protein
MMVLYLIMEESHFDPEHNPEHRNALLKGARLLGVMLRLAARSGWIAVEGAFNLVVGIFNRGDSEEMGAFLDGYVLDKDE